MKRRSDARLTPPLRVAMGCGGLLFALCGLLPAWALLGAPLLELGRSSSWATARCEVLFVGVERAGEGHRPLVAYAYRVAGRERISARFEVLPNDYKTEESARAAAGELAPGRQADCYVSPSGTQAVLKRRPNRELLLGLVPLVFLVPAFIFLWLATRPSGKLGTDGGRGGWLPGGRRPEDVAEAGGPVTLQPASTPLGRFLGLLAGMLVWNGLTGAFVAAAWNDISLRELGFGALCFAPFPLVGLLLLWAVVYRFFALFSPRACLTLSRPALRPGESVAVSWQLRRMAWRARSVDVALLGRETAPADSDGTAGSAHVFLERPLGQALPGGSPTEGRAALTVPAGLMHSFEGGAFKVEWLVRLRARVLLAPDLEEEFPLVVLPERPRP